MNSASFQSIDDLDYYNIPQLTKTKNNVNQQETNNQIDARAGLQTNPNEFKNSEQSIDTISASQPQQFTTFSGEDLWPI
jgi:hypothetical protein